MTKRSRVILGFSALMALTSAAWAATSPLRQENANQKPDALSSAAPDQGVLFHPEAVDSEGSVTVEGSRVDYRATAGTIIVHPKDWDDAAWREHPGKTGDDEDKDKDKDKDKKNDQDLGDRNPTTAEASMFYVAYFKKGAPANDRPITFLFNGGPGSATVWLHMGAFGPRRVQTPGDTHMPAAPYKLVDNAFSLLDVSGSCFHRRAGNGFFADRRQGQGKGLLWRRSRCLCLQPVRAGVSVEIWPLEFTQIPFWRKLRHAAQRQSGQYPGNRQ